MNCVECGSSEFVGIDLPCGSNSVLVVSAGKEVAREDMAGSPRKITVCKECGKVCVENG